MSNSIALNPTLTIADIIIRQDDNGRYCLNDLHKASGGEQKNRPNYFLDTQQTKDLIAEIESTAGFPAVEQNQAVVVINGGNKKGTYGVKDIVYAYAMWISPAFTLKVIRAYDALVTGQSQPALKSLPLKKTKVAVEGGLSLETQDELKNMINDLAATLPKDKQTSAIIGMWSALSSHFDAKALKEAIGDKKLAAYKFIPEASRLECLSLLARLPFNDLVTLSHTEMTALIDSKVQEKIQALPAPAALEGEVLPKPTANSVTLTLVPLENRKSRRWLVSQFCHEALMMNALDDDVLVRTREQLIKELRDDNHLVAERTAHDVHDMIMKFTPIQLIPVILEAATTRMQRINWQMPA